MLQGLIINLKGPICGCKKNDLVWGLVHNNLQISCQICGAYTVFPYKSLGATIRLEEPYPEGNAELAPVLELVKPNE